MLLLAVSFGCLLCLSMTNDTQSLYRYLNSDFLKLTVRVLGFFSFTFQTIVLHRSAAFIAVLTQPLKESLLQQVYFLVLLFFNLLAPVESLAENSLIYAVVSKNFVPENFIECKPAPIDENKNHLRQISGDHVRLYSVPKSKFPTKPTPCGENLCQLKCSCYS